MLQKISVAYAEPLNDLSKELSAIREPLRRDVMRVLAAAIDTYGSSDAGLLAKRLLQDLQDRK